MRLHERLAAAREQLVRAGIQPAEAAIDVDLYARTILKWDRARLLLHPPSPVPETLEPQFSDWLARRERFGRRGFGQIAREDIMSDRLLAGARNTRYTTVN